MIFTILKASNIDSLLTLTLSCLFFFLPHGNYTNVVQITN